MDESFVQGVPGQSAVHHCLVNVIRARRMYHRHRIDKYLDTLLANQTARKLSFILCQKS